jgi:hypothetical protein
MCMCSVATLFLKEQWHEIFDRRFFRRTIPPKPLIKGLKRFRIWLCIRLDIRDNRLKCRILRILQKFKQTLIAKCTLKKLFQNEMSILWFLFIFHKKTKVFLA